MAATYSTRSWLPEMLDELERRWSPSLAWDFGSGSVFELAPSVVGAYGTTQTDFLTLPHGTEWDSFEITLTVQQGTPLLDPNFHNWGDFSGSWHAIHRATISVPDSVPTMTLLTLGLGLLGVARWQVRSLRLMRH